MVNKCRHENGWVTKEEFAVTVGNDDNNIEVECECNSCCCGTRKIMIFDISNVRYKEC